MATEERHQVTFDRLPVAQQCRVLQVPGRDVLFEELSRELVEPQLARLDEAFAVDVGQLVAKRLERFVLRPAVLGSAERLLNLTPGRVPVLDPEHEAPLPFVLDHAAASHWRSPFC